MLDVVDGKIPPSLETHVVNKMGPGLRKASTQLEVLETPCYSLLGQIALCGLEKMLLVIGLHWLDLLLFLRP
jgi:hypothetical protein